MKYKIHIVKLFEIQNTLKCLKYVGLFETHEVGPYVSASTLSSYIRLVLLPMQQCYVTSTPLPIYDYNKKLCYREEHSASVVLSWCTL